MPKSSHRPSHVALVLAGGAARGAYEAGVVEYLLEELPRDLGRDVPLDVLCGTSVGAINVCALAAFADEPRGRAARLVRAWTSLQISEIVRPDAREILSLLLAFLGRGSEGRPKTNPRDLRANRRRGGVLRAEPLEKLLGRAIPFERIDEMFAAGKIHGLSISTTHVASGRTIVFVQRAQGGLPAWSQDATIRPCAARIRAPHALASAAIPFLFPAVEIDGQYYCDGGLRQNVPLSPARRLGASGLVVVNPRFIHREPASQDASQSFPGPLFLLGKALNAILLDRIDSDIDRLERINRILDAGSRRFGPGFVDAINQELGDDPYRGMRPMRAVLIRASQDIGHISAEYVRSPTFAKRATGVTGRVLRRLAEGEGKSEADLLSYLLFDGEFAGRLIELGRADARSRHDDLCAFFDSIGAGAAEAKGRT